MSEECKTHALPLGAPQAGEVFAEKYRVDRLLGIGGMGYVLAATHLHLQERVAIKMLLPERATQPETVGRFLREGRAAVRIRSEHVARVLDVGSSGDRPYIVMEYLDGADLADVIRHQKRLPVDKAVDYILQACEAIAEAHAMRTVHRDLKPGNLFVTRMPDGRDCIKVLDFGISKIAGSDNDDGAMTKTSATIGTPLYMSPEQLKSAKNVDMRTDIWALGVILFEMVAGRPPFRADSMAELSVQVLTMNAPDLRKCVPDAAEGLAVSIARCLRRDVRERFASVAELADAIAPYGPAGAPESARRIAQVLANVSPPESVPFATAGVGGGDAPSLASSMFAGTDTNGTWGSATGVVGPDPRTTPGPRSRSVVKWVVVGSLASIVFSVGVGALLGRIVERSDEPRSGASASEAALPSAAAPSPSPEAPTSDAAGPVASASAPPVAIPSNRNRASASHVAPRAPSRAAAKAGSAAAPPTATSKTSTRATTETAPAKDGFMKGRFGNDE